MEPEATTTPSDGEGTGSETLDDPGTEESTPASEPSEAPDDADAPEAGDALEEEAVAETADAEATTAADGAAADEADGVETYEAPAWASTPVQPDPAATAAALAALSAPADVSDQALSRSEVPSDETGACRPSGRSRARTATRCSSSAGSSSGP
jgi:hypothetical protein